MSPPVSRPWFDDALSPSLPRVLAGRVPLLHCYYGTLRLLPAPRSQLIGFAVDLPLFASATSLPPARMLAGGQGPLRSAVPKKPNFQRRRTGLPGSWRTLVQLCSGLRLRRDRQARPLRRVGAAPRHENGEGYPRLRGDFGAQSPGFTAGCLRFVGWVAPPLHARLASGCWPRSAGWD
jgi:hypothetical protein